MHSLETRRDAAEATIGGIDLFPKIFLSVVAKENISTNISANPVPSLLLLLFLLFLFSFPRIFTSYEGHLSLAI